MRLSLKIPTHAFTLLAATAFLVACVLAAIVAGPAPAAVSQLPNVVLIQTDDQSLRELYATWITPEGRRRLVMPHTLSLIRRHGISFSRYYDSYPVCGPSRSSLLSGRYAHNDGVLSNSPPKGGWPAFRTHQINSHNLAIWMQDAGYRTIHIGKFLNWYGGSHHDSAETEVPPGWDDWETFPDEDSAHLFYGYDLNVNGTIEGPFGNPDYGPGSGQDAPGCPARPPPLGSCNYSNDVLTRRAARQIDNFSSLGPFYLQLDFIAPHGDFRAPIGPEPATRDYNTAAYTPLPRPPDFNEADVSDKPSFIRGAPRLNEAQIDRIRTEYRKGIESLRSVDDGVRRIVAALRNQGELQNTYIIFISDNGYYYGEHRLERSKFLPYEPAIHLPLLVRGPGIKPGSTSSQLVSPLDLAPTITKLARTRPDRSVDGESLLRFWRKPWLSDRRPLLLESFAKRSDIDTRTSPRPGPRPRRSGGAGAGASIDAPIENYYGVRLGPYAYVEYQTGDRELYDLANDPYELHNRVHDPRYNAVQLFLKRQIIRLENCSGKSCRYRTGPIPKPRRR